MVIREIASTTFGPNSTFGDNAIGVIELAIGFAVFFGVGWVILQLLRKSRRGTVNSNQKIVRHVSNLPAKPGEPIATFRFTTYTGYGLWTNQLTVQYQLPASQALAVLDKVLVHNLTRGLLGPGCVFVPIVTSIDYIQQRRVIRSQTQRGFPASSTK